MNIHQGACPTLISLTSYSTSLFSVLICFSSKIYVYWNVGCDNHMINFANEDFELPDSRWECINRHTYAPTFLTSMQLLFWSSVYNVEVVQI